MKPVITAVFSGGGLEDRKTEEKMDALVSKNIEEAHNSYDGRLIVTTAYQKKYSTLTLIQYNKYGNKDDLQVRGVSGDISEQKYQQTLLDIGVNKYYAKKGKVIASSKTSLEDAVAKVKKKAIKASVLKTAEVTAKIALYSSLFMGVNNLFALFPGALADMFPLVPDILISAFPFYSVQRFERGTSDRLLKYRAIGDVFLAHQKGATDTLRVDMTLIGPYRNWYLLFLLMLQARGEGSLKELPNLGTGKDPRDLPPHEVIKVPKKGKVEYETHVTFPIITKTSIMLDMFLQTIEWHQEKDRGGHDVVYTHLLFRKHIDPKGYKVFRKGKKKLGTLEYGKTQTERLRSEVIYDAFWKAREMGVELLNVGMFGASDIVQIDMEAVAGFPYATDVNKLAAGYTIDINNLHSEYTIPGVPHPIPD
jgi:hypothetical protein